MSTRLSALLIGLTLTAIGASALAQEGDDPASRRRPMRDRDGAASRPAQNPEEMKALIDSFKLPPEKDARVRQILQTTHQAMQNWQAQRQELQATMRPEKPQQPATDADKTARQAKRREFQEQMDKLMEKRGEIMQNARKQLAEVLTPEQVEKVMRRLDPPRGPDGMFNPKMLDRLDLTPEQHAKVELILQEARKQAQACEEAAQKRQIMQAAHEKIRTEVLTEEQRQKLAQMRPGRDGPDSRPATGPRGPRDGDRRDGERPRRQRTGQGNPPPPPAGDI